MSEFVGNYLIEWHHFPRENVYSTVTLSCDLYILSNFIHKVTSLDHVCPPRARTTAIAELLFYLLYDLNVKLYIALARDL